MFNNDYARFIPDKEPVLSANFIALVGFTALMELAGRLDIVLTDPEKFLLGGVSLLIANLWARGRVTSQATLDAQNGN